MKTEIQNKLNQLAIKKSIPFCYGCYKDAPTGRCGCCGSDDLMRKISGVGWMTFDTVTLMQSQDPISWKLACGEWESMEEDEGSILSFDNGSTYYCANQFDDLLRGDD